ncbi:transposable element Tc1 transposase isoform X1 [Hypanus sabinus]|uniref:transposable element Tc1 transposase isoform X1 n=1 Tax=Hypanus sabinus TaxID=79690 RepID=UPI0028C451F9|nr:transposable element Tc1 transposase isoform X1 [Hypanus sabinus]
MASDSRRPELSTRSRPDSVRLITDIERRIRWRERFAFRTGERGQRTTPCRARVRRRNPRTDAFWKQVLWTDEVKVELFGGNEQRYFWREKGAEFHEKNPSPTVKHRGGSIMPWACVVVNGTGNISLVEGRMNSIKYQQILEANITPSV